MQPEPLLKSTRAFMRWGGQHAQFLGVVGVMAGALVLLGTKITQWAGEARNVRIVLGKDIELLRNQIRMEAEVANARVAQARAEAIKQTTDSFLRYGYVEEYKMISKEGA
ncbi:g9570 [Coccomyxa elongata]